MLRHSISSVANHITKTFSKLSSVLPTNHIAIHQRNNFSAMAMSKRPSITHIIFDMDGLLLDPENFYSEVQEIIMERYGKKFDWSLKAKMMGKKALESAKIFVEEMGISDSLSAEEFLVEREDMLQKLFPTCNLLPGESSKSRNLLKGDLGFGPYNNS